MKIGFVSAILADSSFEQVIDTAQAMDYQCVEMACWPKGKAERRYAGVCHIDVQRVLTDELYVQYVKTYAKEKGISISALAFYPNPLDSNVEKQVETVAHLKDVIAASAKLGIYMVTTFIGREQTKNIQENLALMVEVWKPIIALAETMRVKIAIENCPMLFDENQWPGGQNLMTTPAIWRQVFDLLQSEYLGINYDPSHFVWQKIDYIQPLYDFKEKVFHVHFKDIKLYEKRLAEVGTMAYPLEYMQPKLPGLGDVNWGAYVSALTDIGYDSFACVEVEDKSFEGTPEKVNDSLILSKRYLEQFVI